MIVERTWWEDGAVRFTTDDGTPLTWTPGRPFHWTVGSVEVPVQTPMYVFEPRPVERIVADLDAASTDAARDSLMAERRLCDRPHVVYIAFHGTLPKVGMTSKDRFRERLQEQGADAGLVLATAPERAAARTIEQSVAFRYGIPEWRTHKEVLPQWTRPVDRDRIRRRAEDLTQRLTDPYAPGDLEFFDHPLPVLPSRPHKARTEGTHAGTVVGAKGDYLVYRTRATTGTLDVGMDRIVAFRRRDLEGRRVEAPGQD